ncbi:ferritin-like domain-containing protein [Polyangium spumosum]|uniref:Iminophenyl-pyruvate dimer synthase domain-containing protein n=1 Tax=Polyangium spumosum TaxID=889282 RepID=A0A6N7PJW9_9BACT|nr:ferritin-like domain-containing protein [Polyangium spumosum]MRG90404.1 hypothetical protein [Polyangium spumosum]
MKSNAWTEAALRDHLQKAVYLEIWTIPIYLTAAYSLQVPGSSAVNPPTLTPVRSPKNPNRSREQLAFNNIYSVVVQEMLHLEIACNLYNALFAKGSSPKFTGPWAPRYDKGFPPWIGAKVPVELGPVNEAQLLLMSTIETPEPKSDPPPDGPQEVYDSIGQFYKAIEQGVDQLWESLYDPSVDHRQASAFANPQYPTDDYTGFSATIGGDSQTARAQADKAIRAIVDQGEGSRGPFINKDERPADDADLEDRFSHYARFRAVQAMLKLGGPLLTYPQSGSAGLDDAQRSLNVTYTRLLSMLEKSFAGEMSIDDGLGPMWALPGKIVSVWAAGGVPAFQALDASSAL